MRYSKKKNTKSSSFSSASFFHLNIYLTFLPYLMLKATTVKRKEDLVKEQRREREKGKFMYLLVRREDVDDGMGVVIGKMCVREAKKREMRFSI